MLKISCQKSVGKFIETSSRVMERVNDTVGPFIPCISVISALTKEIADAYENAQYNKKTCGVLVNRIEAAEAALKGLVREKEENIDKFLSQGYNKSLDKFVICLKNIRDFCNDITQLSKFKKFYTSRSIKEKFREIIEEFDECSKDLNLAISITTNEQMNKYLSFLQFDMIEMMKFLDNIEGGITSTENQTREINSTTNEILIQNQEIIFKINNVERQNNKIIEQNNKILEYGDKSKSLDFTPLNEEINKIYLLNEQVNNSNLTLETNQIMPSELTDASQHVVRKGSILKKVYRAMDVACKPISMKNIQKHLAILEKLNICPYIIQFHGLSEISEKNVMVFEWAEHGNLREIYLNNNIRWDAKISIARDICRGLAFLHSVNILHHDLKCENILITENMQPKISNFSLAREFNAITLPNDNVFDIIHWMAPEKLECIRYLRDPKRQQDINRYTIQCEIFSYGMLLWELAFQKKPYENKSLTGILDHVLSGGREALDIELDSDSIQKEYCAIIKLAWVQEPSLRPGIQQLFNMLQKLYEKHNIFPLLHPMQNRVVERSQNVVQATIPSMAAIQQIFVIFLCFPLYFTFFYFIFKLFILGHSYL
ncbi:kinase-like domain-containing protein [Rhizophagus clarus]|uniref:Kinase-like domain-containing protein n=1 Tax=Rhizophagus clarus TaxID=94130 RepID=A0A8H3MF91_9GLOM|nr:kinase-like domain-containing protein [Rhizophagus clarus]